MPKQTRANNRSGTQSVERALALLRHVCASNKNGGTLSVLSNQLRLHRTTAYRLLMCLVNEGALRYDATQRLFFLGPLAIELGLSVAHHGDLPKHLSTSVQRIADITGDTCFLILRSGNDAVCIDRKSGSYPIKTLVVEIGTRRPLGIGAGGLAILSALSENEANRVIRANATRVLSHDSSPELLLRSVRITQRAGYSSGPVLSVPGAISVGVAVVDVFGNPFAALSIAAIEKRMSKPRQIELIKILDTELRRIKSDTGIQQKAH